MTRKLTVLCLLLVFALSLPGCAVFDKIQGETGQAEIPNPIATITMKSGGTIKLELYPNYAPNTVANFVELIESGFYDGLIFHRVIAGFMIQGGDPLGTGTGGPGWSIKGEFSQNGFTQNTLQHTRGVISMARSSDPDSAGSQFFIMHGDASYLDGGYAAFGQVTEGMDTVDYIANIPTDANDKPLNVVDCTIDKVTVDTFGYKYTTVKKDAH